MNINSSTEDHLVPVLIDDTVQTLKFFPSKDINYLASGGWDSKLRLFEINYQTSIQNSTSDYVQIFSKQINECKHQSPILSISWKGTTGALFTGCADGSINYVDCQKNIFNKIGEHQYGCKEVLYINNLNALITGGWDGLLKLWDLNTNNLVKTYQFYNKIYSMSYAKNLLVIALSENVMAYFNLDKIKSQNIFEPELIYSSHIKSQIKKILVLNEGSCYLEGSAEGRIAVKYINLYNKPSYIGDGNYGIQSTNDFAFKCHREIKDFGMEKVVQAFPINDMSVNPVYGTVATAGGNGNFTIWDIGKKSKVYDRENTEDKSPITAIEYNANGNLLAYSTGYDWSKGAQFAHLYPRPKIFIHYIQPNQRKSKG